MIFTALCTLFVPLCAAAPQQDSFEEQVKAYEEILDDRDRESEAIALIDRFVKRYQSHTERLVEIRDLLELDEGDARELKKEADDLEEQQEDLADLVWDAFKERKRDTEGHRQLWTAVIYALGQMGPYGAEHLWDAFEDKRFDEAVDTRELIVEQIGATRDWKQWEELVDLLDHHEYQIIAGAARGLTHYRDAPGKVRLEVTEKLVNFLNSYYNAQTNPEDTTARQLYRIVRRPMFEALTAVTGQSFQAPLDWRKWFNDNKKNRELWSDD